MVGVVSTEAAKLRRQPRLTRESIAKNNPNWDELQVEDYEQKGQSLSTLETDVAGNTDGIALNALNLANHISDAVGAHAASAISYDGTTSGLSATEAQAAIDEVDGLVDTNTTNIGTNAANITSVTNAFNTHNGSSSQHGVTGVNVGTEDFALTLVGGVVLLAANVADAVASTVSVDSPDATAAPVAYDQTQAQTVVTLANELKADVNTLVTDLNALVIKVNEILSASQTAKQMSL